jgi:hypothetical protein
MPSPCFLTMMRNITQHVHLITLSGVKTCQLPTAQPYLSGAPFPLLSSLFLAENYSILSGVETNISLRNMGFHYCIRVALSESGAPAPITWIA